jgi:RDD family
MTGTPYVPSSRLERVPPARASVAVAWAVDLVVAGVFFTATAIILVFLLMPWGLEPGDSPISARLHPWAAWTVAIAGIIAATFATSLGRGQRSPGRQLAEIKTTDLAGGPAPAGRRIVRAAVLPVLCVAVLPAGLWISAAIAVLLLCTCLVTSDRRGLADRVSGLRDYQTDLVPYRPDATTDQAIA